MAPVDPYGAIVQRVLAEYAALKPSYGEIDVETIVDEAHGHYELMHSGWNGIRRVHGCVLHIDVRGGKIWIQHDGTEQGVAGDLLAAGVPADHIVLAFKHPSIRKHTEFAEG